MCNYVGGYDVLDASGRYKTKTSQVSLPSRVFVFIDENEDSIEDCVLGMYSPPQDVWLNLPASRHLRGLVLSFMDGHVERWKWKAGVIPFHGLPQAAAPNEVSDLHRLQDATPLP